MMPVSAVALLLFGSGLCALIYQMAWLRELRLVFGASTAASAAVLAIFMGGLGLGGAILGRRAARRERPLALYANLELGVAAAAALTPLTIAAARSLYAALGGTIVLGLAVGTVVRLAFTALVLGLPTFLMGGTLPAAVQAAERDGDVGRRDAAVLYGANTLGAVAGTLLATFALLEILGTRRMLWCACLLNALVAMAARRLARAAPPQPVAPAAAGEVAAKVTAKVAMDRRAVERFACVAAALVGLAFLLMELVWYRMLGPLLGGSSFTFGLILAVALLGIGAGGAAYALLARRRPTPEAFALSCAVEALAVAFPYLLGDRLALLAMMLQSLGALGFPGHVAAWSIVTAAVVLPVALVSGWQFPLLVALVGEARDDVGRHVGLLYAWNTVGALVGSLLGGFGLLPLLGAPGAWRLVAVLLGGLAVVVQLRARARRVAPVVVSGVAMACLLGLGPTAVWRHGGIGVGRAPRGGTPNSTRGWMHNVRRSVLWEREGRESSVAVEGDQSYGFIVNGKVDGNARGDAETQVMGGLLGAILHGHVRKAMVIGLGTGSTAGWLGAIPSVEKVDVAELEPAIVEFARACAPVNQDVLDNPKVHLFLGDAREMLLTVPERYDLVFSEPSNPYRAGIASLFTREYYEAASRRLADDGVFVQWVQAYSVDAQTVRTIYATLGSVFPAVETWVSKEADLMLVASKRPLVHDVPSLRALVASEPFKSALEHVFLTEDLEGLLARFVARPSLARAIAELERDDLNTDDQTLVEFGFARAVNSGAATFNITELRAAARKRDADRPELQGGEVDWLRVFARRISMMAAQGEAPRKPPETVPEPIRRRALAAARWVDGDCKGALEAFGGERPDDPVERLLVAECRADAGDEGARPLIDALRAGRPIEADVILGRLRLRQGRLDEAVAALEPALVRYRSDPWPPPALLRRAILLAPTIAERDQHLGERLYAALQKPFAASVNDSDRRSVLLALVTSVRFERGCVEQVGDAEPWVPWRADFLDVRRRCYESVGDPRAEAARRDLERFLRSSPLPFDSGL